MLSMRIAVATLALFGVVALAAEKNERIEAVALITGPSASGNVTFIQNGCGEMVHVKVYLTGLSPGKHGFHVHEKGDLTNGCTSTGGHYNPEKVDHAGRHDESRHVGDLGNVEANSLGVVDTVFSDRVISLNGKYSIIGRAVVVHDGEDDEGKTTHPDSKKTGNAGGRAGCGIIGVNSVENEWPCRDGGASQLGLSISMIFSILFAIYLRNYI